MKMNIDPDHPLMDSRIRVDTALLCVVDFPEWIGKGCKSGLRRLLASLGGRSGLRGLGNLVMGLEVGGGGLGGRRLWVGSRGRMRRLRARSIGQVGCGYRAGHEEEAVSPRSG